MIDLNDSTLTILTILIKLETYSIKTASVGLAYLHVSRRDQQFRKTVFSGGRLLDIGGRGAFPSKERYPPTSKAGKEYRESKEPND